MKKGLFLIFSVFVFASFSQVGPRVWQDHLGLSSCNTVSKLGTKVYASNGNCIIRIDEQELSPENISKINGLSDVGISFLRTNPYNNKLLVIYQNCNIDVIGLDGNITNYPDFKLKTLNGKKVINEVTFYKQLAYLACGFGIIVFDTEKLEIKETYIIGPNASNLEVYQTAISDSVVFAATPEGLYHCNYKLKNPNNFNNWLMDSTHVPKGSYCGVSGVSGKILAAYAPSKLDPNSHNKDTLYVLDNGTWSKFKDHPDPTTIRKLGMTGEGMFSVIDQFGVAVIDVNTKVPQNYFTTFNGNINVFAMDVFYGKDYSGRISYWIGDLLVGLYQCYFYYDPQNKVSRNGTHSAMVSNIDVFDGRVAVSPSHPDAGGGSIFTREGINILKDNEWSYVDVNNVDSINPTGQVILDIDYVYFDRKDKNVMWASAWSKGLMQFKNNKLVAVYNHTTTPILPEIYSEASRCSGMEMDGDGNLWFANSDVKNFLSVRKKDGTFVNYTDSLTPFIRRIMIDRNDFVWVLLERDQGIEVFRHENFVNYEFKYLSKDVGQGDLETNTVYSIAEDHDGKIWVGTNQGIRVFYNSAGVFDNLTDSEPIKIVQDGNVELLLGKESVMSIVVDGANNKWCGTDGGGVYCFSPDGIQQIYHFTKENSPLNSNSVIDMNYNEVTGDIFIGTDAGVQTFRSISIQGDDTYTNVIAYPNPVRPNYNGTVLVRGLVDKSVVKITDIAGNLVWETKSAGGQIEWPITTLSGSRVTSGVYIVYASTTDGEQKALTKILVVN